MGLNARFNAGYMDLIIRVTRVTNLGWGDAYLQAPSATTRRKHKTLPQNAISNGGDASRVGDSAAVI